MKKLFILFLVLINIVQNGKSQINENFSNGSLERYYINSNFGHQHYGDVPSEWTEYNEDGLNLSGLWDRPMAKKGWRTHILTLSNEPDTVAVACSIFGISSRDTANDWLITPEFTVPEVTGTDRVYLLWEGSGKFPGASYDVHIGTKGSSPSNFDASTLVYSVTSENTNGFQLRHLDLTNYMNQDIYLAFNYNSSSLTWLFLDDIRTKVVSGYDAEVRNLQVNRYQKTTDGQQIKGQIMNWGPDINQIDLVWDDGSGPNSTTLNDIIIPQFSAYNFTHGIPYTNSSIGEYTLKVFTNNINSSQKDINNGNDTIFAYVSMVNASPKRNVLVEESTGTWCTWCPRGIVLFDIIDSTYIDGSVIPIAVHTNFDPMTDSLYNKAINRTIKSAPRANLDRHRKYLNLQIDPQETLDIINERKKDVVPAEVNHSVAIDSTTREITINATAHFYTEISTGVRFAAIVVEDSVTGTTSDYNQANAYSGGTYGPMGGFENKPNPIPASQMVYNHVGRHLIGGYEGVAGSIEDNIMTNSRASHTFQYTVPDYYDINHLKIVTILVDENDGQILNAVEKRVFNTGTSNIKKSAFDFRVFPNPSNNGIFNIELDGTSMAIKYDLELYSLEGNLIYSEKIDFSSIPFSFSIPTNVINGMYMINVSSGSDTVVRPLVLNR